MRPLWIIGASGHGRVVLDGVRASEKYHVVGLLDDCPDSASRGFDGFTIEGPVTPATLSRLNVEHAIVAVGVNRIRQNLVRRLDGLVRWATIVHPLAYLAEGVEVGEGTYVAAGALVLPGTTVGRHVILNTASSVDHDSTVCDFAHVAPGARTAGNVWIGEGALLGIGSCVLPQQTVGAWATIGGGAVVIRTIPPGVKAMGVPARVVAES